MNPEIIILILFFGMSLILVFVNQRISVFLLLLFSVLLHKEFFSMYHWDVLPIRIFMTAFTIFVLFKVIYWVVKKKSFEKIRGFLRDPFVLLFITLWLVRGFSIIFSKNLEYSLLMFGFFTTICVVVLYLYTTLLNNADYVLSLIRSYFFVLLGLCGFAVLQFVIYLKTGFVFGALWNVPGHLPRVGATFWDVNHFAGLLAALLPVLGVFILVSKTWIKRILYLLMFLPMGGILVLTNSRSAWIIAFVAFFTFVTLFLIKKFGARGIIYILLAFVLIAAPLLNEYGKKSSPFRASVKQYFHYRIDSYDSHFLLLRGSYQVFEKYPFFGGGYGGFFEQFSKTDIAAEFFSRDPAGLNVRTPAHSIWGENLAETGIFGIATITLLFSLMLGTLFYGALTLKDKKKSLLLAGMGSSIFGWLIAGIFQSYKSEFFWLTFLLYFSFGAVVIGKEHYFDKVLKYFLLSKYFPIVSIILISFPLIFLGLGVNHLIPWDEAIYAKIAKEMVESQEYLVQFWVRGTPWFEKPPLYMWFMSLSMRLFGITEFAARLPSAIFGFSTVILTYFIGKHMFNKLIGFISAFVLLTTFQFLYYSRASMLDVTLTFFLTLSLFLYYIARESSNKKYWIASGIACGLAIMTKSIIGFLVFPVIGLYELYLYASKEITFSKKQLKNYVYLVGACFITFLPWHLVMLRQFGFEFVKNYLGYHVLTRAITGIEDKGRPWYWYLIVLRVSMRIWFVALLAAFPFSVFYAFIKKQRKFVFLFIWSAFIFVFFSISKSKLVWYVIPTYPPLALIVGIFIENIISRAARYFRKIDTLIFKSVSIYILVLFGLLYLFLNKELVYLSDLTGPQATLLLKKDEEFGIDAQIFADRIERPLILYYSDSPYEVVDFGSLRDKLLFSHYSQEVIFITKESRFRSYAETHERLELVDEQREWVLGKLPSVHSVDLKRLDDVRRMIDRTQRRIDAELDKGLDPISSDVGELELKKAEEIEIMNEIVVGLSSIVPGI